MLRTGGLPGAATPGVFTFPQGGLTPDARRAWVQAVLSEGAQQTQGSAACSWDRGMRASPALLTSTPPSTHRVARAGGDAHALPSLLGKG